MSVYRRVFIFGVFREAENKKTYFVTASTFTLSNKTYNWAHNFARTLNIH